MAIDYIALKNEINTDPKTLGYAGKTDPEIADLLNEDRLSGETIDREEIDGAIAHKEVIAGEFEALSAAKQRLWLAIVSSGLGMVDIADNKIKTQVADIWGAGTTTRANLQTLATRDCSRAEKLFGVGTLVGHLDVGRALRW